MPEQEPNLQEIVSRLEAIENNLRNVTQRIWSLEQRLNPTPLPKPPVATDPTHKTVSLGWVEIEVPTRPAEETSPLFSPQPAKVSDSVDDLEYQIGLTGLLRGGAVVIVIAIVYLVGLAVSRGYITQPIQFAGEIVLCLGFIGLGILKRNEREEFGQLMVGIGSCGLYLSFAGGHFYKHLYQGETLVVLFVGLSLTNLAFSYWRSARSFLAIGMLGGLIAAAMPTHRHEAALCVGLHLLILVPSGLVVYKNRWIDMALAMWVASTLALVPILDTSDWVGRTTGLYAASLLCTVTYAAIWQKSEKDKACALPVVATLTAGSLALFFDDVSHGSLHILFLAAGAALAAAILRSKEEARNALIFSAIAVATILVPIGLQAMPASVTYSLFAALLAAAGLKAAPKALLVLGSANLAMSLCAYIRVWTSEKAVSFTTPTESGLILAAMSAAALLVYTGHRTEKPTQEGAPTTAYLALQILLQFVIGALLSRLLFIGLTGPAIHLELETALAAVFTATSALWALLSLKLKWSTFAPLAWVFHAPAFILSLDCAENRTHNYANSTALFLFVIGTTILTAIAQAKANPERGYLTALTVLALWVQISILGEMFFVHTFAIQSGPAFTLSWIAYAVVLIALGFSLKARYLRYWSLNVFAVTVVQIFFVDLVDIDPALRVILLMLLGLCMVGGGYWYIRSKPSLIQGREEDLTHAQPSEP